MLLHRKVIQSLCKKLVYLLCPQKTVCYPENAYRSLCMATDVIFTPELNHSCPVHTAEYWSDMWCACGNTSKVRVLQCRTQLTFLEKSRSCSTSLHLVLSIIIKVFYYALKFMHKWHTYEHIVTHCIAELHSHHNYVSYCYVLSTNIQL